MTEYERGVRCYAQNRMRSAILRNSLKLLCGNSIYDFHELSNALNDHFSSIGPKLANNIHANEDNFSHLDYLAETGHCMYIRIKTDQSLQGSSGFVQIM